MKLNFARVAVASALFGAALSGCVVAPARLLRRCCSDRGGPTRPQYEVVGVAPTPGYIWIGGAWFWEGGRHVCIRDAGKLRDRATAGCLTPGGARVTAGTCRAVAGSTRAGERHGEREHR